MQTALRSSVIGARPVQVRQWHSPNNSARPIQCGNLGLRSSLLGVQARRSVRVNAKSPGTPLWAPERPLWLPGGTPPAHLDGTMVGAYNACVRRLWEAPSHAVHPLSTTHQLAQRASTPGPAGDFGFDPLNLGAAPEALKR
jgi:hypothetical protein